MAGAARASGAGLPGHTITTIRLLLGCRWRSERSWEEGLSQVERVVLAVAVPASAHSGREHGRGPLACRAPTIASRMPSGGAAWRAAPEKRECSCSAATPRRRQQAAGAACKLLALHLLLSLGKPVDVLRSWSAIQRLISATVGWQARSAQGNLSEKCSTLASTAWRRRTTVTWGRQASAHPRCAPC